MRRILPSVLLMFVSVALAVPAAQGADNVAGEVVRSGAAESSALSEMEPCEGYAPIYNHCVRQFEITGPFTFLVSVTFNYRRYLILHYFDTAGNDKTVACPPPPEDCQVWDDGTFVVGETLTLEVYAPAVGFPTMAYPTPVLTVPAPVAYWRVSLKLEP